MITIRISHENDIKHIYKFICALEETQFDYTQFEILYHQNLNNPSIIYQVALSDTNLVIGFISVHIQTLLHHCGKVAEIQELFVEEGFRQLGVGCKLIQSAENKLQAQGCLEWEVTAQVKRAETHAFYKNAGFAYTHKKFTKYLSQH